MRRCTHDVCAVRGRAHGGLALMKRPIYLLLLLRCCSLWNLTRFVRALVLARSHHTSPIHQLGTRLLHCRHYKKRKHGTPHMWPTPTKKVYTRLAPPHHATNKHSMTAAPGPSALRPPTLLASPLPGEAAAARHVTPAPTAARHAPHANARLTLPSLAAAQ